MKFNETKLRSLINRKNDLHAAAMAQANRREELRKQHYILRVEIANVDTGIFQVHLNREKFETRMARNAGIPLPKNELRLFPILEMPLETLADVTEEHPVARSLGIAKIRLYARLSQELDYENRRYEELTGRLQNAISLVQSAKDFFAAHHHTMPECLKNEI